MDKEWKNKELEKIRNGNSIFQYIPNTIGSIIYCDTDEPREEPISKEQLKKKRKKVVPICSTILILLWCLLYTHYIWATIISLIILFVAYNVCIDAFAGTDFFIGEHGFAIVRFIDDRKNIWSEKVILFDEMEYLFTGETVRKLNYVYQGTDYYFSIYGHADNQTDTYNLTYLSEGSYNDKKPKNPMNPNGAPNEYTFMKEVEKQWTLYFFNKHQYDKTIAFGIYSNENICSDYITVSHNYIEVGNVRYTNENWKRIYFSNGELVIEHANHSKKLLGLLEKGDISHIPLSNLGNRQAFLLLFNNFFKS